MEKINCALKIVDSWLSYYQFMRRIPGLSVGIVHKDKIIFKKGYGFSDLESKSRATHKTLYRVASISKLFTATAIMQLVEKEELALDDLACKYLPWLKSKEVTLRQLLTHSSGLNRDGDTSHWTDYNFPSLGQIKKHVSKGAKTYEPIEKFKYSNLGYGLLGRVIESASGLSYEEYVQKNILEKVGMRNTYVDIKKDLSIASGYGRNIPGRSLKKFKGIDTKALDSATGFVSNAEDLCKFMSAHFFINKLLSEKSRKEMQRVQWVEEDKENPINWGIGFQISKVEGVKLVGHGGHFPGFITKIAFDGEFGVAILTNSLSANTSELINGVFHTIHFIMNNFGAKAAKKSDLKKYEGRFYTESADIEFVEINNSLNFIYPAFSMPLKFLSKLKKKKGNVFSIETGSNFDYIGEDVEFEFDKSNKISKVKIGPNVALPFEK